MRVSCDRDDAGYTGPNPKLEIRLNGQVVHDVVTADDQTGELVRYRRDAENRLIVDRELQCVETEALRGVVTIAKKP